MSKLTVKRSLALFGGAVLLAGLPQVTAQRAFGSSVLSFVVNTTADLPDASPGDGLCADSAGQCSLRAAIQESDAQPSGTVTDVSVPAGTYALSLGPLSVTKNTIDITGSGSTKTVVRNAKKAKGPLVVVAAKAHVELATVELTGGSPKQQTGGAVDNSGSTILSSALITHNSAPSGGGLTNSKGAILTLIDSTVSDNSAVSAPSGSTSGASGGGIVNAGTLQLTGSVITGNTAGEGAFGYTDPGGHGGNGGGIDNTGTVVSESTSITSNSAGTGGVGEADNEPSGPGGNGGGIYSSGGSVTVSGGVVSDNESGYPGPGGEAPFPKAGSGGGIWSSAVLKVSGTTFSGNDAADPPSSGYAAAGLGGSGGAIYTTGTATISASVFTSNAAGAGEGQGPGAGGDGGAIANLGTLALTDSTIADNDAGNGGASANGGAGGGLYSAAGSASLTGDTFDGNTSGNGGDAYFVDPGCANAGSGGDGGAIFSSAALTLTDSTISGNSVGQGGFLVNPCAGQAPDGVGAGVAVDGGSTTVSYSTIADNSDGVDNLAGTVTVGGTIVADNVNANCTGSISEGAGYNLDSSTSCGFAVATDITSTEPLLGSLSDNGGPTLTQALLAGSPAIDHGGTAATGCPATDQRGLPRPDEASDNGVCDIGAYESQGEG
jgi:CSLREA domain-containing protein